MHSKGKNILYYFITGIVLGLAILCDPIAFVFYPAIFLWFVFRKITNLFQTMLIVFISIVVLIPWTIRNYFVHRTLVPITTQFGVNFWIGNNPNATGTDFYKIASLEKEEYVLMTHTLPKNIQDSLNKVSEIERANFYIHQGLSFVKEEPLKFIFLLFKKFYYYFWFPPSSEYSSKDLERYKWFYYIFYLSVLISGLIGIIISIRHHRDVLLVLTILSLISGLYIFTHIGLIRYRMPLELYLLMFSAFFIRGNWR